MISREDKVQERTSAAGAKETRATVGGGCSWRERCRRRLGEPLSGLLGSGLPPVALTRALTVGMLLGCMPLIWGTTLLCLGVALLLRINPLAVQVGNFAAWPLQILLAYPYVRLGRAWFGPVVPASDAALATIGHTLAAANGAALVAWALTAPLLMLLCYPASRLLVVAASRLPVAPRPVERAHE